MEIKNCKLCGRIYNYVLGPNLCPACKKKQDDKFHEVKQFIYDNPGVGVGTVAEEMDVSVAQIRQWVREERLQFAEGSVTDITCESCGQPINTGRYCARCKEHMVKELGNAYHHDAKDEEHKQDRVRMHYLK